MSNECKTAQLILRLAKEDGREATYYDALESAESNAPEWWGQDRIKAQADEIFMYMRMICLTEH